MMPLISLVSAFLTALALFWLIVSITEDALLASVGTLIVIVGSALIIGMGAINGFYENGVAYPFFPFLRRYIPSLAFPFLFAFFACLWNGLQSETKAKQAIYSAFASLCFAVQVYSYFYVWTAAGAVIFGLALLVLLFRSKEWRKDFIFLTITGALCLFTIVPYAMLLADRSEMMDKAQLLVFTRQPDLLRTIEVIGYIILTLTALALWKRFTKLEEKKAYFIGAFALAPFLVFNQQVLTGRSLQPFHYEFYVINYVVLLAIVLIVAVFWQRFISSSKIVSIGLLSILGLVSIGWGCIEARETTAIWDSTNVRRDEAMPVNLYLRELAAGDIESAKRQITLNLEAIQADSQPTVAPQAVLWARHQHVFAGLKDWDENKKRYFQMLYYSDLSANSLRQSLINCRDIEACMALFGWDRFNPRLSANARPLTRAEIELEVQNYAQFSNNFSIEDAQNPLLTYVIVYNETRNQLINLDAWYERVPVKITNEYTLYEVKIKQRN
jgi:hypothetical protein